LNSIRVVVGEDDYLVRQGLVRALEEPGDMVVVAACTELDLLWEAIRGARPDAVVVGDSLLAGSTFEKELGDTRPEVALIILGRRPTPLPRAPANHVYLARSGLTSSEALGLSVRRAVQSRARLTALGPPTEAGSAHDARFEQLTTREREVIELVALGASNAAISTQLGITTRAVERHINSIFRKLAVPRSDDVNRRVKVALLYAAAER
jgi:DNA-binding NarL/FixJ family response regulator